MNCAMSMARGANGRMLKEISFKNEGFPQVTRRELTKTAITIARRQLC